MNREKKFDDILNECIERVLRGEPLDACLAAYPEHAAELEPLLRTALDTKNAAAIIPRAEFRQRAANDFQDAIRKMAPKKRNSLSWQIRWVTAISVIMALLLLSTGTVLASDTSLPDNVLYPVKLAAENVRLKLASSPIDKAEVYVELTDRRVDEIVKMADKGKVAEVEKATERMNGYLVAVANLALPADGAGGAEGKPSAVMSAQSVNETPSPSVPSPLKSFAPPATDIAVPAPTIIIPPTAASPALKATPATEQSPVTATAVSRAVRDNKAKEKDDLRTIVFYRAEKNRQDLEAVLKRAPDSVKPALERAIDVAGKGYNEAIKNIERD